MISVSIYKYKGIIARIDISVIIRMLVNEEVENEYERLLINMAIEE